MIKNKVKRIETSLLIGLAAALLIGSIQAAAAAKSAENISSKLIRLHVLAASDSEADQAVKLKVRDAVVPMVAEMLEDIDNVSTAKNTLESQESKIALQKKALEILEDEGFSYGASVSLTPSYFPTRHYDNFSLPAGEYDALKIVLGTGEGANWWCVLFPPLCLPAAEGQENNLAAFSSELNEGEIALITEESGYKLKFKMAEIWGDLKYHLAA